MAIGHAFGPGAHPAFDGQDELGAQHMGAFQGRFAALGAKDDLGQAAPVAQIDKDQAAVVAAELGPAHQANFAADIGCRKRAAIVAAPPIAQYIEGQSLAHVV